MSAYSFDVTTAEFKEKVIDASLKTPVVVDFWAEWCGPCKVLKPLLEKLADEYKGRFLLAKVNSDENPELAGHFGIRSIPTVVAIVNGQIVDGFTGAQPEGQLRAFLDRFVPPAGAEPEPEFSLLEQARAARERGEHQEARRLLGEAYAANPDDEEVELYSAEFGIEDGALDEAEALLNKVAARGKHNARVDSLLARIKLARRGAAAGADIAKLEQRLEAEPDNHQLRIDLADALVGVQNYRAALDHLLASVKKDKTWNDGAARKAMIDLFNLLGGDEETQALVREYRTKLAGTLN